jgi:hypothetical protein
VTVHPSVKASTNRFSTDPDVDATRRAVLTELAQVYSLTTGQLQVRLYGSTLVGATNVASAIGDLRNRKLVERAPSLKDGRKRYRITPAGSLWLTNYPIFTPDGVA